MKQKNTIIQGDCREVLKSLPSESVDCIITSPPYFGLRDYGTNDQIGMEKTPSEFINELVCVFREAKRALKDNGTLWVNMGDSYARNGGLSGGGNRHLMHMEGKQNRMLSVPKDQDLKEKDLIGIPWMLAFALRADGWYLRQDIIWSKPNPMPESVTDRCTKSHEYIFLLSKSKKYYYDHKAIMTDIQETSFKRLNQDIEGQIGSDRAVGKSSNMKAKFSSGNIARKTGEERGCPSDTGSNVCGNVPWEGMKANKRSVWTVSTKPFKEAHFATFPKELIIDCIKAGCPEDGIVLDMFIGAGTTAIMSRILGRNFIGIELNPEYIQIAEKRIRAELGLFA